jgi:hypothetical protein
MSDQETGELVPAEWQGETAGRAVLVLHDAAAGRIYIGQSRAAEADPEAGQ